jgi:transposase
MARWRHLLKEIAKVDLTPEQLDDLVGRVKEQIEDKDYLVIKAMAGTIIFLAQLVEEKNISLRRVLRMLFGARTETSKNVLGKSKEQGKESERSRSNCPSDHAADLSEKENGKDNKGRKRKGHGRNGAAAYTGADKVRVSNTTLKAADPCPLCSKGKIYKIKTPGFVLRLVGRAPIHATVYELEKLRCNLCGEVFTAKEPDGIGDEKYDETVGSTIALLKYGSGFPFYRLEQLQGSLGIPLAASTQWDIMEKTADRVHPAYHEIVRQGAQGDVIYNDDTTMKILALMKNNNNEDEHDSLRTGMFTTGILSTSNEWKIGLFFTGRKHSGENISDLLQKRELDRAPPIQMCDALSRNMPKELKTILANCLSHSRRYFVDVVWNFPEQCQYVIETLAEVYKNDEIAKEQNMSPEQRLRFHQAESGPLMEDLKFWLNDQLDEKKVEPNSGLGKAISYMLNHWQPLTLFLRVPNAPLDNNLCEQALKKTVLNRKNSLFYKTEHGAYIGDLFMSLIYTCNLNEVNPFNYLTELQKNSSLVFKNPQNWMPWNYKSMMPTETQ